MKSEITFNLKEITMMMINVISVKLFFGFPERLILNSGNAAWIQVIYISAIMLLLFMLTVFAYKNCSNYSIISLSERIGGKAMKQIVGLIVSFVLFLNLAATIRSYPDMVKMVLLPDAPIEMILLIYALVIAAAAYCGIESIARIHAIFIPIVLVIMVLFFAFLAPRLKLYNIFPILGNGPYNIFVKGISGMELFDDFLILNLLLPYIKNATDAKKAGRRAILTTGAAALLLMLTYGMIYPYPSSKKFIIPIYQLMRLVGIGDFFQRFEAFFEFVWSLSVFLYSALYLSVICMTLRDSFDLKYEKPLIVPIIAITAVVSFGIKDMGEVVSKYWHMTLITVLTAFLLPLVLPLAYKITKKKSKS